MKTGPPQHIIRWPTSGVEMAFRLIPAGQFRMGSRGYSPSEEPVHEVIIPEAFWLGETPVTQAQFARRRKAKGVGHANHFQDEPGKDRSQHPAESLDWRQAAAYCEWLTRTKGQEFPPGYQLACLPTEAQWEYACRAGTETEYNTGDGVAALAEAGWFDEDWEKGATHPVGKKPANQFKLHDMHGNVWEWCRDVYDRKAYRKRASGWVAREWMLADALIDAEFGSDDDERKKEPPRVLRGGSWYYSARNCRSAFRDRGSPDVRGRHFGFRVCLVRGAGGQPVNGSSGRQRPRDEAGVGRCEGSRSSGTGLGASQLSPRSGAKKK